MIGIFFVVSKRRSILLCTMCRFYSRPNLEQQFEASTLDILFGEQVGDVGRVAKQLSAGAILSLRRGTHLAASSSWGLLRVFPPGVGSIVPVWQHTKSLDVCFPFAKCLKSALVLLSSGTDEQAQTRKLAEQLGDLKNHKSGPDSPPYECTRPCCDSSSSTIHYKQ